MINNNTNTITKKTYKIHIANSNYVSWEIYDTTDLSPCNNVVVDPVQQKLFSNDVFSFSSSSNSIPELSIIHSSIRHGSPMAGVIILADNKTYGRYNKKSLYKCIPDDNRLPFFLIPYEIKKVGFCKLFKNKYVTFTYLNWNYKHPFGTLNCCIGDTDIIENFYEYQLHCKSLNVSIQSFQKVTAQAIRDKSHDDIIECILKKYNSIEDRTDRTKWNIYTIDPKECSDFDDAFSFINVDGSTQQISIYIANVTIWMDILNLWNSFSQRVSTIYLPDKKRPMLPTILSDCLCSLRKNVPRVAFVMDITINNGNIVHTTFSNVLVNISNNFVYEENSLINLSNYQELYKSVKMLSKKYKYLSNVRTSHDIVSYLMILMNSHCAKKMQHYNCGIFRSATIKNDGVSTDVLTDNLPEEISKYITIWKNATGVYIDGQNVEPSGVNIRHQLLQVDSYIHITSPIRRIVDLLNLIILQHKMNILLLTDTAIDFYNNWIQQLEYINTTMRSIRKLQCDSFLLDLCINNDNIIDEIYDGYMFDKIKRSDGLFQYTIYLPKIKMTSRINMMEEFDNYSLKHFKLFLFEDEIHIKKKIRLHLVVE